jgi:hypothetical protein
MKKKYIEQNFKKIREKYTILMGTMFKPLAYTFSFFSYNKRNDLLIVLRYQM